MFRYLLRSTMLLLLLLTVGLLGLAAEVPPLQQRVTDTATLLNEQQRTSLEQLLADYQSKTGNQLFVLTIPSLDGENIEEFANRAFRTYRIGDAQKNNGMLLVVSRDDRKLRIEVGYGLEGVLPDGRAGQIIREVIRPYFRQNDYYGGIERGAREMMKFTSPDYQPPPPAQPVAELPRERRPQPGLPISPLLILGGLAGLMGLGMAGSYFTRRRCPQCHGHHKQYSDIVVEPATLFSGGYNRRIEYCPDCGYRNEYTYRTQAQGGFYIGGGGGGWGGGSSGGSWGGGGGFSGGGGGSSGGGGASGDW